MFFSCREIDKDIIYIGNVELVKEFTEDWVDEYLEQGEGISQSE